MFSLEHSKWFGVHHKIDGLEMMPSRLRLCSGLTGKPPTTGEREISSLKILSLFNFLAYSLEIGC